MIVIAIIGILAAALFPSLTAYLKRSRDAGRSANLNTIATALGAFYSDTERYPIPGAAGSGCIFEQSVATSNYFPKATPADPLTSTAQSPCNRVMPAGANAGKSSYGYGGNTSGTGFVVSAIMENTAGWNYAVGLAYTGNAVDHVGVAALVLKGTGAIFVITN